MKLLLAILTIASTAALPAQTDWIVRESGTVNDLRAVAWGNGVFLASHDTGIRRSSDGINWLSTTWTGEPAYLTVHFGQGKFFACNFRGIATSIDGNSWEPIDSGDYGLDVGVESAHLNNISVFTNPRSEWLPLSDFLVVSGANAQPVNSPFSGRPNWIIATDDEFIAAFPGIIAASSNGIQWSLRSRIEFNIPRPAWRSPRIEGERYYSDDAGKTWTPRPENGFFGYAPIYQLGGVALMITNTPGIVTSTNYFTWTTRETGTTDYLLDVAFGGGMYVAVGSRGRIISSTQVAPPVLAAPTLNLRPSVTLEWTSISGLWYQIQSSPDMVTWQNDGGLIPGSGSTMKRVREISTPQRFFRIEAK